MASLQKRASVKTSASEAVAIIMPSSKAWSSEQFLLHRTKIASNRSGINSVPGQDVGDKIQLPETVARLALSC
jgi:hypothetical protein